MIRRPPRSTLFPTRRSSDLQIRADVDGDIDDRLVANAQGGDAGNVRFGGFCLGGDRKSTRLNSSHANISYAVFCLKKKTTSTISHTHRGPCLASTRTHRVHP